MIWQTIKNRILCMFQGHSWMADMFEEYPKYGYSHLWCSKCFATMSVENEAKLLRDKVTKRDRGSSCKEV